MIVLAHYPSDFVLKTLEKWVLNKENLNEFLDLLQSEWEFADIGYYKFEEGMLELHTGGWSGNEDIIRALRLNSLFWRSCFVRDEPGGHYWFNLKIKVIGPEQEEDNQ